MNETLTAVKAAICELELASIGLDPRPERQVRALDIAWVRHLIEETNPDEWDAIQVRRWPASDPYPPGEEGRQWQVISGYHRTNAARVRGMPTIRAEIVDAADDATFTLLAMQGNLRHGKPMSSDEQRAAVRRLRRLGMSEGEITKGTGIPKGTVHNWLSQRDTNAARPVRIQQAEREDDAGSEDLDAEWRVMPTNPDARRMADIGRRISNALAATPSEIMPADVLAWRATLAPDVRRSLASDVQQTTRWLTNLCRVLETSARSDAV